jgi:hypothetical protein
MTKKVLQSPLDERHFAWIKESMKVMKIKKQPEFVRTMIDYLMETDITELKLRMEKARISTLLQEAEEKAKYALQTKEQLEKQLEKLGA